MKTITTFIIDDEPLARQGLKTMLQEFPEFTIIGEAGKVGEAREFLQKNKPDLIFLDIQLYGKSGFDLIPDISPSTKLIFVTAYDSFALRAFEINALDYLLKPVGRDRLEKALNRMRTPESNDESPQPSGKMTMSDHLLVTINERRRMISLKHVRAITADSEYSEIHLDDGSSTLIRKALKNWESQLPEEKFVRIHRNTIINLDFVERIMPREDGRIDVFVRKFSKPFETSRRLTPEFEKKFQIKEKEA